MASTRSAWHVAALALAASGCGSRSGLDDVTGAGGQPASGGTGGSVLTFSQVTAGAVHTCELQTDDTLVCWGRNDDGQATPPGGRFLQVDAGGYHTCGIRTDGTVACWGRGYAQTGTPAGTFLQVSSGYYHSCALATDGTVTCWGLDEGIPPARAFVQISAGYEFTCGLDADGALICWGRNDYGQATAPGRSEERRVGKEC